MENIRMRCHFSIIFERLWKFWAVIAVILINQIQTVIEVIEEVGADGIKGLIYSKGLWAVAAIMLVTLVVLAVQVLRWRKTWIILESNLLVFERNTLRKEKNTIAIENISAVNMERNLFERIVGTYKVKIDTNSMTTANETDLALVLREDIAIRLRKTIIERMNLLKGNDGEHALSDERQPDELFGQAAKDRRVFHCSALDMLKHSFYAIPILSLVTALSGICFTAYYIANFGMLSFVKDAIGGFVALIIMVIGAMYSIVNKFVKYYDFTAYRDGKDLHIKCGLIKLRSYTIPVDKITALTIEQPIVSRIFGRYNVKVVTVGVGDEKEESSNITMSLTMSKMAEQLEELLPEYNWADISKVNREEKGGLQVRLVKSIKWHILSVGIALILLLVVELPLIEAVGIPLLADAFINLLYILSHNAAGYLVQEEGMIVSFGYFTKRYMIFTYSKMQIMTMTYHPAACKRGIGRGTVMLLNSAADIPYIKKDLAFDISNRILGGRK